MHILADIMWYFLIIISILFLLSGLDELFFDILYWARYFFRLWKTRNYTHLTYDHLIAVPEQKIAIIVACWHEDDVIGEMLRYNVSAIDYDNYDFFIGVYPNDPPTVAAVKEAHELYPHVQYMVGPKPGPTTKADNLNSLYAFIKDFEKENNTRYEIFVMHDSEDIIHPLSLHFYNYLLPRKSMVQLPVFPLEVPWWQVTHWIYNDEFSENHTKDIIVREAIRGLVPSAGVSTGFSRQTLDELAKLNDGYPFSTSSFTEDYNTALRIKLHGLKGIFVFKSIKVTKMQKKWKYFGKFVPKITNEIVASRSLFPTRYTKAVRQKARWIMGISMQEWRNVGWPGSLATRYTLLHDRKTLITHYVNIFGYLIFLFWVIYFYWQRYHPYYPTLQEYFSRQPWVWTIIVICTFIMFERLLQRCIAVYRVYGFIPAILSITRAIYGNIINMHALLRAYRQFFFASRKEGGLRWDKTEHSFPTHYQFKKLRSKLGTLLLEKNIISEKQLKGVLSKQKKTGKRLGDLLIEHNYLTNIQLLELLAEQDGLDLVDINHEKILTRLQLPLLAKRNYRWLLRNRVLPIELHDSVVTAGIHDPSNKAVMKEAIKKMKPYKIKFVVYCESP